MVDDAEMEGWKSQLQQTLGAEVTREGAHFSVEAPPLLNQVRVPPAPEVATLSIRLLGEQVDACLVNMATPAPHSLSISVGVQLRKLRFRGEGVPDTVSVSPSLEKLELQSGRCRELILEGGDTVLQGRFPDTLSLAGARVQFGTPRVRLKQLQISGDAQLLGGEHVHAAELRIDGDGARLRTSTQLQVERARSREQKTPLDLVLEASADISLKYVAVGSVLTISTHGARIRLGDLAMPTIDGLTIKGSGVLQLAGSFAGPRFEPTETIDLLIQEDASLEESTRSADGRLILEAQVRSRLSGMAERPFSPNQIRGATGADLEHMGVYDLGLADLNALAQAERLSPTIGSARQDRAKTGGMFSGEPGALERIAHFWTRLSHMVREKSASGVVQSDARFVAAWARRKAAMQSSVPWRWKRPREAMMLSLYELIGFGERFLRPLLVFVLIAAAIAWGLDDLREPGFLTTWGRLLLAPLSLFRVEESALQVQVSGVGAATLVALEKVAGVVLVGVALLAARKVVRASD